MQLAGNLQLANLSWQLEPALASNLPANLTLQLAGNLQLANLSWQLEPALASNLPGNLQLADNLQLANFTL